jgi:peptidoglycan/LPS O-acetylase OafA/YrhL
MGAGTGIQKNPEIEALRGIAILFVLFAHLGALLFKPVGLSSEDYVSVRNWFQPGTGVDLFFCISGFVITQSIFRHGRASSFLAFALPFWLRRFWRLAPTVWLWAAIGLATVAWRVPEYLTSSSIDMLATIAQVQNFRVFDCMNHSVPPSCGAFVLYWSLSLEEQF